MLSWSYLNFPSFCFPFLCLSLNLPHVLSFSLALSSSLSLHNTLLHIPTFLFVLNLTADSILLWTLFASDFHPLRREHPAWKSCILSNSHSLTHMHTHTHAHTLTHSLTQLQSRLWPLLALSSSLHFTYALQKSCTLLREGCLMVKMWESKWMFESASVGASVGASVCACVCVCMCVSEWELDLKLLTCLY